MRNIAPLRQPRALGNPVYPGRADLTRFWCASCAPRYGADGAPAREKQVCWAPIWKNTVSGSVNDLHPELDLPRRGDGVRDLPRRRTDFSAGEDDQVGRTEVGMVQQVEALRAELELHAVADLRVLEERDVHTRQSRPPQTAPAYVAERPHRRHDVRIGIEPLRRALFGN